MLKKTKINAILKIFFKSKHTIKMTRTELNLLGEKIIGAAIEVHRELGPGLLESVYEHCLLKELKAKGLNAKNQVSIPIIYKKEVLDKHYIVDILVEDAVILELKCVEETKSIHEVQLVTYLKLADKRLGYLLNFNVPQMVKGVKRKVNKF